MRFQQAQLPYLFRLAEFPNKNLSRPEIESVEDFLWKKVGGSTPTHLVIFGTLGTGKTTLATGIGTEAALNNKRVRYLTFDKLQDMVEANWEPNPPRGTQVWFWRTSELMIVDDVFGLQPRKSGEFETETFWVAFLGSLRERVLADVRLCSSYQDTGVRSATIARSLACPRQR